MEKITQIPTQRVIPLDGPLCAQRMEALRPTFDGFAKTDCDTLMLDLSAVERMDASGVGALVFLFKRLKRANRGLIITGVHGQPEAIIRLLRMDQAIPTQFKTVQTGAP